MVIIVPVSDTTVGALAVQEALARLETAVDALLAAPLDPCADAEIEDLLRRLEVVRNRSAAVDVQLLGQVEQRSLPFHRGCKSARAYLKHLLRVTPAEA